MFKSPKKIKFKYYENISSCHCNILITYSREIELKENSKIKKSEITHSTL